MLIPWLKRRLFRGRRVAFSGTWDQDLVIIPTYKQTNAVARHDILGIWWHQRYSKSTLRLMHLRAIIDKFTTTQELRSATFEGGNPLLWDELDQALFYLHQKKIRSIVKTDGTLPLGKSTPGTILVNLRPYLLDTVFTAIVTQHITQYVARNTHVSLLWPIHATDTADMALRAVELARQHNLPLVVHPALLIREIIAHRPPVQATACAALQTTWHTLKRVLKETTYSQLRLGTLTPSAFPGDATFSQHPCRTCSFARSTIQPDGTTVSHCLALPYSADLRTELTLTHIYERHFSQKIRQLEKTAEHALRPQNCLAYQAFTSLPLSQNRERVDGETADDS